MNLLNENIKQIAEEAAERKGFFLVDFVVRGNNANKIFEIYIDGEKDVSADDCADLSREIDSRLEDLPGMGSSYRLEVSSPGIDRPLKFLKQFPKNINRKLELSYLLNGEKKTLTARLIKVEGEDLIFLSNKDEILINFNNIQKAKVLISFS